MSVDGSAFRSGVSMLVLPWLKLLTYPLISTCQNDRFKPRFVSTLWQVCVSRVGRPCWPVFFSTYQRYFLWIDFYVGQQWRNALCIPQDGWQGYYWDLLMFLAVVIWSMRLEQHVKLPAIMTPRGQIKCEWRGIFTDTIGHLVGSLGYTHVRQQHPSKYSSSIL